jgi:hypothetical protein
MGCTGPEMTEVDSKLKSISLYATRDFRMSLSKKKCIESAADCYYSCILKYNAFNKNDICLHFHLIVNFDFIVVVSNICSIRSLCISIVMTYDGLKFSQFFRSTSQPSFLKVSSKSTAFAFSSPFNT